MRATSRVVACTAAALVLYGAVLSARTATGTGELFPFFSWELFSRVPPAAGSDYGLRLTEMDGRPLARAVYFEKADAYVSTSRSPEARELIQRLGRHLEAGDASPAEDGRQLFETRYLQQLRAARYEVVRRRYDLFERFDCDCFTDERVLAVFERR